MIFGLGNPGVQYRETRHNCGFRVVDELARRWNVDFEDRGCRSLVARGGPAHLVKPQTYMNRSGFSARCLVEKWGYRAGEILVVFDDIDLPLGTLRLRESGSPGGHRGLESVIENLRSSQVPRLRIGIQPATRNALPERDVAPQNLADFVLAPFDPEERSTIAAEILRAANACESWIEHGTDCTMDRFNGTARAANDEQNH